ncbi:hypothetical protein [Methanobrevibacter sp. DSM 116169]|uniref:hypothetical protein n=1 Tax=Methanobrevibacter sp. DSM 116169 TaxID=3242727 RepID=UPI0038FCBD95
MNSFDGKDFIYVAKSLSKINKESYIRSAAGRYYYSIFWIARKYIESECGIYLNKNNVHSEIIEFFKDDFFKKTGISESLNRLRIIRNHADYGSYHFNKDLIESINKNYNHILNEIKKLIK